MRFPDFNRGCSQVGAQRLSTGRIAFNRAGNRSLFIVARWKPIVR
jgi:hypothetical protein